MIAPSLAGRLSDIYGLQAVCWLLVVLAVLGGTAALFLRETLYLAPHFFRQSNAECFHVRCV